MLLLVVVDFQHDAVDGKRQLVAFHIPIVDELEDLVDGLAKGHEVGDVEPPALGCLKTLVMRLITLFEAVHHHVIAVVVEVTTGHFLGVLQLERSSCGVARIGKEVFARFDALLVEFVETLEGHHNLAAHLEEGREVAMQLQRHGADGLYIGGDVVALRAVATGDRPDEHAVLVLKADAQAIELQLAAEHHFLVDGFLDAADEVGNLLAAVAVGQREHRVSVLDALKLLGDAASDTLCGRGRRQKLGKLMLQSSQFLQHHVELIVADGGLGENIIIVVVLLQLFA